MDVNVPLQELMNKGNYLTRLTDIEERFDEQLETEAEVGETPFPSTGIQVVDLLIAPSPGVETLDPTDTGFTGVFTTGNALTYGSEQYNWGAVKNGTLAVGANIDGIFEAGNGEVTLDENGIQIKSASISQPTDQSSIQWLSGGSPVNVIESYYDGLTFNIYNKKTPAAGLNMGVWTATGRAVWEMGGGDTSGDFEVLLRLGAVYVFETVWNTSGVGQIVFNYQGYDINVFMHGNTLPNVFFMDAGKDNIGIGTNNPDSAYIMDVYGDVQVTGRLDVNGGWNPLSFTYFGRISDDEIQVVGDKTADYDWQPGTKIKWTSNGVQMYGVIKSVSYAPTYSNVVFVANDDYAVTSGYTPTDFYVSHIESPEGWPEWFNYSPSWSAKGSMTISSVSENYAKWSIQGLKCFAFVSAEFTLGGTADNIVYASSPVTCDESTQIAGTINIRDASSGGTITGQLRINSANDFSCLLRGGGNWSLGSGRQIHLTAIFSW